jgi:hypothetical protein
MWADRILQSAITRLAVDGGHADLAELTHSRAAWRRWPADDDGWFLVPHGEVVCRPSR